LRMPFAVGAMGRPKSTEESMHSLASRPGVGSTALDAPTIGPFVASMEAIRETAPVLDKIAESSETARTAPARKRDNDHASGHDADH
jgi:hypothetical protein